MITSNQRLGAGLVLTLMTHAIKILPQPAPASSCRSCPVVSSAATTQGERENKVPFAFSLCSLLSKAWEYDSSTQWLQQLTHPGFNFPAQTTRRTGQRQLLESALVVGDRAVPVTTQMISATSLGVDMVFQGTQN